MYLAITCCGEPMVRIPARSEDVALGFEYLIYCYECGHYEPWDTDDNDVESDQSRAYGRQPREDRS